MPDLSEARLVPVSRTVRTIQIQAIENCNSNFNWYLKRNQVRGLYAQNPEYTRNYGS